MEFVISLVVLVAFAVLMIGNAIKTSRAPRQRTAVVSDPTIDRRTQRDAA